MITKDSRKLLLQASAIAVLTVCAMTAVYLKSLSSSDDLQQQLQALYEVKAMAKHLGDILAEVNYRSGSQHLFEIVPEAENPGKNMTTDGPFVIYEWSWKPDVSAENEEAADEFITSFVEAYNLTMRLIVEISP